MIDSIDWTDETLRSLDELARIAFPPGSGVTANTLKLRARQGKLAMYRPGKAYLSTLVGGEAMVEATRVPASKPRGPSPAVPNALGLNEWSVETSGLKLNTAIAVIGIDLPLHLCYCVRCCRLDNA
jgi:hypothetical protein